MAHTLSNFFKVSIHDNSTILHKRAASKKNEWKQKKNELNWAKFLYEQIRWRDEKTALIHRKKFSEDVSCFSYRINFSYTLSICTQSMSMLQNPFKKNKQKQFQLRIKKEANTTQGLLIYNWKYKNGVFKTDDFCANARSLHELCTLCFNICVEWTILQREPNSTEATSLFFTET